MKTSSRARKVWQKLSDWYGARFATQYGDTPPEDWAKAIDRATVESLRTALAVIRQNCIDHPPTLPQLEKALRPPMPAVAVKGDTVQERLCEFIMRTRGLRGYGGTLTEKQVRRPWTYRYARVQWSDAQGRQRDEFAECIGVDVPSDGELPGFSVKVEDMDRSAPF